MTPIELKQLRDSKGLTQQAFADALDINVRTYKRWEHKDGYKASWGRAFGPSVNGKKAIKAWLESERAPSQCEQEAK